MRVFVPIVMLICLASPAYAGSPGIVPLMEDYYGCLVGHGSAGIFFAAKPAAEAYSDAKGACQVSEAALRAMVPLVDHEDGEQNEADFVEGAAQEALAKL